MTGEALEATVMLPPWAQVSEKRRAHIGRVIALLERWAAAMRLPRDESSRWTAAGALHDALRDAPEKMLRALTGDGTTSAELLHGPAAAIRAEQDGERRQDVLEATRFHTVGNADWGRTGRALYLADFLEPGRPFIRVKRARLADKVPRDFDGAFREVVQLRIEMALREGGKLFPETVAMWNAVR
jgi:2-amino-4-hydroxy-6-hydroxymethyldihydropteridine diphosphokinase